MEQSLICTMCGHTDAVSKPTNFRSETNKNWCRSVHHDIGDKGCSGLKDK
jgi:hypothetical protein